MMEAFTKECEMKLQKLVLPHSLQYNDASFHNQSHSEERDGLMFDVVGIISKASHKTIPMSGGSPGCSKEKKIHGLNKEVEAARHSALLWHCLGKLGPAFHRAS